MKQGILEITLQSDLCNSDGGVYNSSLDTDVCHDEEGFPYIPAKRIRGCLRECALELHEWGMNVSAEDLFGKGGDTAVNKGKIRLGNAYLKDYSLLYEEVKKALKTEAVSLFHEQNILDHYSYVRYETSIDHESGTADPSSLRSMRVINKGLVFEAVILFEDDVEEALKNVVRVFHHMGIARTRGLGEVKAELKNVTLISDVNKEISIPEGSNLLKYEIYLEEPVVCKSAGGSQEKTVDYIEGSKIMGVVSQRLQDNDEFIKMLDEGKMIFSDAILEENGIRLTEVPASVYAIKNNKKEYRDKLYEPADNHETEQLSSMKHCYVYDDGKDTFLHESVETEIHYHHTRPVDKSIGRADPSVDSNSTFYQISSISPRQTFAGYILGNAEEIRKIAELLNASEDCYIGNSKSSEYGYCRIFVHSLKKMENHVFHTDRLAVKLNAPALIYNNHAMASVDPQDLIHEILVSLQIDSGLVQSQRFYLKYGETGGFNVTWGMKKPTLPVFDQGTVVDIHFKNAMDISVPEAWHIGERTAEGFGETIVISASDEGSYHRNYTEMKTEAPHGTYDLAGKDFMIRVAEDLFVSFMRAEIASNTGNVQESLRPTVANMIQMCHEQETVDDVRTACELRYGKKSERKSAKLNSANQILEEAIKGEEKAEKKFTETYRLLHFKVNEEKMKKIYLQELLQQLKYSLREVKRDA